MKKTPSFSVNFASTLKLQQAQRILTDLRSRMYEVEISNGVVLVSQ